MITTVSELAALVAATTKVAGAINMLAEAEQLLNDAGLHGIAASVGEARRKAIRCHKWIMQSRSDL